jgi:hypothetical protein
MSFSLQVMREMDPQCGISQSTYLHNMSSLPSIHLRHMSFSLQVMREMDPECGISQSDRRLSDDGIFRWRVGRVVAQLSM